MNHNKYPLEVILSVLFPEHARDYKVSRGEIAAVNGLLFRNIKQSGEEIERIATERSKPEILKQHKIFAVLTSEEAAQKNIETLRKRFRVRIRLVRVVKNLPICELQPTPAKKKRKQLNYKERKKRREEELRASLSSTREMNEATG